jgi:hypothetical protein
MKHILAFIVLLIAVLPSSWAQHTEDHQNDQHNTHDGVTHKLTLVMANSFLNNGADVSGNSVLIVPTFGLNYDFLFHPMWGVGFHTDIVLQQFKIERHDGHETIIRENPIALVGVGLFSPIPSLTLIAGYGIELETNEHIQLLRFGVEYGFHLPKHWELGVMLEFDRKINTYNSLVFGVGFSKLFVGNNKD